MTIPELYHHLTPMPAPRLFDRGFRFAQLATATLTLFNARQSVASATELQPAPAGSTCALCELSEPDLLVLSPGSDPDAPATVHPGCWDRAIRDDAVTVLWAALRLVTAVDRVGNVDLAPDVVEQIETLTCSLDSTVLPLLAAKERPGARG